MVVVVEKTTKKKKTTTTKNQRGLCTSRSILPPKPSKKLLMVRFAVCLDGTEHSQRAFDIALRLMKHDGSDTLNLITASRDESGLTEGNRVLREALNAYFHRHGPHTGHVHEVLLIGHNRRHLTADHINKERYDHVLLGTRGLAHSLSTVASKGTFSSFLVEHCPSCLIHILHNPSQPNK